MIYPSVRLRFLPIAVKLRGGSPMFDPFRVEFLLQHSSSNL